MVKLKLPTFFKKAQGRQVLLSGSGILTLAVIVVLLNLISRTLFLRFDWTIGNRYSLSAASVRLVRSLPDPVLIRVFLSEGLPQPYQSQGSYIRDLLQEFRSSSRGKVKVEIINPDESEKAKGDATRAGIVSVRFTQVAGDQFQVREGYIGLALFYQDKQSVIPFIKDTDSLEYDISSRVKQMSIREKKVIAFVEGHQESSPDTLREGATGALFDRFDVEQLRLSTATAVSPDVVFVLGPRDKFTQEELVLLDGYLEKGIPLAVFVNRRVVNLGSFFSMAQITGLESYLEHYGVRVDRDFVLDGQCQRISLQSQQGPYAITNIVNYPAIPLSNSLNKKHLLTKGSDVLSFPFVHPLSPSTTGQTKLNVTTLAESSGYSWISPNLSSLDPYTIRPPSETDPKGPFPLAMLVEGSTTAYSDATKTISSLRLIVVGTSFFVDPQMPLSEGNPLFFVNLAEWLSQDANLLTIPSKGATFRPLKQLGPAARAFLKFFGYFFLPVAVILGAVWRWRMRKALRLRVERKFQTTSGS